MAGEEIVKVGTQRTLEASGASCATGLLVQADDASYGVVADGSSYPDAEFALTVTYSVAPTEGTLISLYARVLNIDGTADTDVPEAARPGYVVGSFVVNNTTSAQTLWLYAQDVPLEADYYIHNNGTGQTISSGWVLKVKPRSRAPAP
jgi:hypothetical protein